MGGDRSAPWHHERRAQDSLLRNPDFPRGFPDKNNMTHALAGLVPPPALPLPWALDALHALPDLLHRCLQPGLAGARLHGRLDWISPRDRLMAEGH